MRPIQQDGAWGAKQKKEYIRDPQGKKIYDPKKRQYKCKAIPATDWNEQTKAEEWRAAWAQLCNRALEQYGHNQRNRDCRFVLWKDSKFFSAKKKKLTKSAAASLLKEGRVKLTGCWSEKTGKTYDATVILEDDGERTNYKLEFSHE